MATEDSQDRVLSSEGFDQLAAETLDPSIGGVTQKTRRTGTGPAIAVPDRPAASFIVGLPQYGQNGLPTSSLTGADIAAYEQAHAAQLAPGNRYLGTWNTGKTIAMDVSQSTPGTRAGLQEAHDIATSGERVEDAIGYFDQSADYDQTIDMRDVGSMLDVSWQQKYTDQPNLVQPPEVAGQETPIPDPARRREALAEAAAPSFAGSWKALPAAAAAGMDVQQVSENAAAWMNVQRQSAFQSGMGQVESRQQGVVDSPGGEASGSALT